MEGSVADGKACKLARGRVVVGAKGNEARQQRGARSVGQKRGHEGLIKERRMAAKVADEVAGFGSDGSLAVVHQVPHRQVQVLSVKCLVVNLRGACGLASNQKRVGYHRCWRSGAECVVVAKCAQSLDRNEKKGQTHNNKRRVENRQGFPEKSLNKRSPSVP